MSKAKDRVLRIQQVHCSHTRIARLTELKPHPRNANIHPAEQIAALAKIIAAHGWRHPIVVSKRSGLITRGHGRLLAAQFNGDEAAPIDEQEYASELEELADLIADNNIAELSYADTALMRENVLALQEANYDLSLVGLLEIPLHALLEDWQPAHSKADTTEAENAPMLSTITLRVPSPREDEVRAKVCAAFVDEKDVEIT